MIEVRRKIRFGRGRRTRKAIAPWEERSPPSGRVPRVARLMALAIRLEGLLRDGVVLDQAELARMGHVSRARLTQIMNLLHLAPDLQEAILFLPERFRGRAEITEGKLRPIAATPNWGKQRQLWKTLREAAISG
ncbi:MAG TPA: hypothetical protein DCQ98_19640 [Planctomycetaceae bacterium]|nr:hypothetical protein [Planctomycetaceae bacterium]